MATPTPQGLADVAVQRAEHGSAGGRAVDGCVSVLRAPVRPQCRRLQVGGVARHLCPRGVGAKTLEIWAVVRDPLGQSPGCHKAIGGRLLNAKAQLVGRGQAHGQAGAATIGIRVQLSDAVS